MVKYLKLKGLLTWYNCFKIADYKFYSSNFYDLMTHELVKIFETFLNARERDLECVLATVVALRGSSYRRPGVRMLVMENNQMVGSISGGCVEREVQRQAVEVFRTGVSKIMLYDGRYRLGCEGVIYILLEPFNPSEQLIFLFKSALENRTHFQIKSYYQKKEGINVSMGSYFKFPGEPYFPLSGINSKETNGQSASLSVFEQIMPPCFKLVIFGVEHDAVQLCALASLSGWEVTIICRPENPMELKSFPGAKVVKSLELDGVSSLDLDHHTAVILMTHNFSYDLNYLLALKKEKIAYLGLLGAASRREKLITEFFNHNHEMEDDFLSIIHGPAGINIGSETPQEIAVSIIAEILSVTRGKNPIELRNKLTKIHD